MISLANSEAELSKDQQGEILRQISSAADFMVNNQFNYNEKEEPHDGVPQVDSLYTDESYWSLQSSSSDSEAWITP